MKEFLPILIGLLYFGFQIYSNYKKEQEKAQKRNPSIPVGEAMPQTTQQRTPVKTPGKTVRPTSSLPQKTADWAPRTSTTRSPMQSLRLEREKPVVTSIKRERYQNMKKEVELPEEVLKLRAFKEQKKRELEKKMLRSNTPLLSKSLSVEYIDSKIPKEEFIHFDLKQAVIHSVILERKY